MKNLIAAGGLINAALFDAGLIFASVMGSNHVATVLALASAGIATLCYGAQLRERALGERALVSLVLHIVSNGLGLGSAALLVWGYFS